MKSASRIQTLEELLHANQRRLHMLEKQAAQFGARADPSLLIEIEDLRHKIANIEQTLDLLVSASGRPAATPTDPRAMVASAPRYPRMSRRWIILTSAVAIVLLAIIFVARPRLSPGGTLVASPTAIRPEPNRQPTAAVAGLAAPGATVAAGDTTAQAPVVPLTVAPAVNLTNSPGASTAPRIVFDAQDNLHLTWTEDPPQKKADRLYKRMAPDGTWTEAEDLTADFGDLKGSDWLLRAPDGSICMFWYGGEASNHPFTWALRKRCLSGAVWSPPEAIDEGALVPVKLALAYTPDGTVQTLASGRGGSQGIYFGNIDLFGQGYHSTIAFAIDSNGRYHATWNNGEGLQYRSSNDGGQTWSKEEQLSDEAYSYVQEVLVADGLGRVHLLWGTQDSGSQLYYQRWSAATGWGTAVRLTTEFTRGAEPALAVDSTGRVHTVWSGENGIFYTRQVSDDTFAEPVRIAERGEAPVVALNTHDVPYFAWIDMVGQETDVFLTAVMQ